jgi:hypothetical protein
MGSTVFITVLLIAIVGYFVLYFTGRKYLENFDADNTLRNPDDIFNQTVYPPDKPYITSPIYDLDDYELSVIFQNQSGKEASQKQISDAMSRYPMDWSNLPQNSQVFEENKQAFLEQQEKKEVQPNYTDSLYKEIDGSDMKPLDTGALEAEEQKILQTYKPESSKGLLSYSLDDVKHLVDKIYKKRGLIPTIVPSKQARDAWEITEVQPEHPNIVWEDDVERMTERERQTLRNEELIQVPYTVTDLQAGLDPFYQARSRVREDKYNYTGWVPGLERAFAPTYPIKDWY